MSVISVTAASKPTPDHHGPTSRLPSVHRHRRLEYAFMDYSELHTGHRIHAETYYVQETNIVTVSN